MKAICNTWFLPAEYCGCAKCTGVTPPRPAGSEDEVSYGPPVSIGDAEFLSVERPGTSGIFLLERHEE